MSGSPHRCAALLVSAPASGQGKTTVTAALARRARRRGLQVRVFKTGPDFIDPMILERACGQPVHQLDLWMGGAEHCRGLLYDAAAQADLILIEGVMGLYDGEPSSADLAQRFGILVLAVIDGSAMAQTFGAVAFGLSRYREQLPFYGVLANRVGNAGHARMLAASLPSELCFAGTLLGDPVFTIPERHLGLLQANEIANLDARLDAAADALGDAADLADLTPVEFSAPGDRTHLPRLLDGVRIAVARDAAFSFIYHANLELLEAMGANLHFFSPLADLELPTVDAVYLPGGYPELYARRLAENAAMRRALQAHAAAGRPLFAECGGMMTLLDALTDRDGHRYAMAGLLPGETAMQPKLQALALQAVDLGDGELRGHSFHYSRLTTPLMPMRRGRDPNGVEGEAVYRDGRLTASYIHFYMPSNPRAAARLFMP